MYGLPRDFDGSIFVKEVLNSISFSVNNIVLSFNADLTITSLSAINIIDDSKNIEEILDIHAKETGIIAFIGKKAISVKTETNGRFVLNFENKKSIEFQDDSTEYESYIIYINGKEIIV